MPKAFTTNLAADCRHRSAYQTRFTSTRTRLSVWCRHPMYHSFLRPSFPMASFWITQLSQLVNATSSTSRVILKARSSILLPSNNLPFPSICTATTLLVSPIMADQHRASIFGSRSIISCRTLCFRYRSRRLFFHFSLLFLTSLLYCGYATTTPSSSSSLRLYSTSPITLLLRTDSGFVLRVDICRLPLQPDLLVYFLSQPSRMET